MYRYARRWAVGESARPEAAIIYDSSIAVINDHYAPQRLDTTGSTARADRYIRFGHEAILTNFVIPVTVPESVVILHRFARRYTNGRGSYTAAIVNDAAKNLLLHGISLDGTLAADGTIWAADGMNGQFDGLNPEDRAQALAVLPRSRSDAT